jgi:DNA-binding GntR family transcriptional regulator
MTEARRAVGRIDGPPSLAALAADELRRMILNGELRGGERVVENRLTVELGISRPPLREALRVLEQEGLVVQTPRRGASVRALTLQDIYEIVTLREDLERMAVRLGVPATDLGRLRAAVETLEAHATEGCEDTAVEDTVRFHTELVALAGHGRVDAAYRALSYQLRIVMTLNRRARADSESLVDRAARHRHLLTLVERGDAEEVLTALHDGGSHTFLRDLPESYLDNASAAALAWRSSHL